MAYKEIDDKTLDKLHKVGLEVLKELDRVCKKYDIPYFLCGGTLLGSIRHKGFIPWDDDIDVGMLRKDYEKFEKCYIKEHSKDYFLQSFNTDKDYWLPFMKLRKNNTTINEKDIEHLDVHKGIFVDIFPFDIAPDNGYDKALAIRSSLIKLIIEAIFCKKKICNYKETRKPFVVKALMVFKTSKLIKIQYKLMNKDNNKKYDHCVCFVGNTLTKKDYISMKDIFPVKEGPFEKNSFNIPKNPEVYLTNMYNDYMKLPPKDKRRNHNAVEIDFSNGKSMINED